MAPGMTSAGDRVVREQLSTSQREHVEAPHLDAPSEENFMAKYNDPKLAGLDSFQKLRKLHKVAPPLASYEAAAPLSGLVRFGGTALEMSLESFDFWLLFSIHCALSVAYFYSGYGTASGSPTAPGWPKINTNFIAIPGGLTAFVIVFYLNQAFSRFLEQNNHAAAATGSLGEYILLLRIHLADHSFPEAEQVRHQLCNLVNAAIVLAFSMHPNYREDGVDKWGWYFLIDSKFLTPAQVEELKPIAYYGDGRLAFREILLWANRGLWAQESRGFVPVGVASLFTTKLWEVRAHLEALYSMPQGPVPFAYFHLLNFIVLTYLFVLSYAFVFIAPVWSIPGFFFILVGILGVRQLSIAMSNPLGHDKTDIPVFDNVQGFLKQSTLLINRPSGYGGEGDHVKPVPLFENNGKNGL